MNLVGTMGSGSVEFRQNPNLASFGDIDISQISSYGYEVDSFIDTFAELSLDGGSDFERATRSQALVLVGAPLVPTLGPVGIVALLLGFGAVLASRRQTA
jgi:hypothetical protein